MGKITKATFHNYQLGMFLTMMLVTMPVTVVNTWGDGSGGGGNMDVNTAPQSLSVDSISSVQFTNTSNFNIVPSRNLGVKGAADGRTKKSWSGHIGRLLFQISLGNLESAAVTFVTSPGCSSASFSGFDTVASGTGDTSSSSSNSTSKSHCRVDKTYIAGLYVWIEVLVCMVCMVGILWLRHHEIWEGTHKGDDDSGAGAKAGVLPNLHISDYRYFYSLFTVLKKMSDCM